MILKLGKTFAGSYYDAAYGAYKVGNYDLVYKLAPLDEPIYRLLLKRAVKIFDYANIPGLIYKIISYARPLIYKTVGKQGNMQMILFLQRYIPVDPMALLTGGILKKNTEMINYADLLGVEDHGYSIYLPALRTAIHKHDLDLVRYIVENLPVGSLDYYLELAVQYDDLEIFKYLISQGAVPNNIFSSVKSLSMAENLLLLGQIPNNSTFSGIIQNHDLPLFKYLFSYLSPDTYETSARISAHWGNLPVLKILLAQGIDNLSEILRYAKANKQPNIIHYMKTKYNLI